MTAQQVAEKFGCSVEQVREQYIANVKQMEKMAEKATNIGKKVRGFTAEQLYANAADFRMRAA